MQISTSPLRASASFQKLVVILCDSADQDAELESEKLLDLMEAVEYYLTTLLFVEHVYFC